MMPTFYSRLRNQQGMALVLVLWVITLLTIMAGSFALSIRREASVISSIRDNSEASAIARAGIVIAQQMLLNPDKNERWLANGTVYPLEYGGADIRIKIYSEKGKININKANKQLLESLIKYVGIEADEANKIVDAILDWRDSNDLVRLHGAEKGEYADEGLKYVPRNKPFQSMDELQLVLGVDQELFQKIEPMITIYSSKGTVDKNSATEEVLSILAGKTEEDLENNDSEPFPDEDDEALLLEPDKRKSATTTQGAFTVIVEARLINGAKSMIKAIINRAGLITGRDSEGKISEPFSVLAWTKLYGTEESLFATEVE